MRMNEVIKNIKTFVGRVHGKEICGVSRLEDKAAWSTAEHTQAMTKSSGEWGSRRARRANGTRPCGLAASRAHTGGQPWSQADAQGVSPIGGPEGRPSPLTPAKASSVF